MSSCVRRRWGKRVGAASWLFAGWLMSIGVATAQGVEALGTRALGMGGAFVAVADDATAVYWNPAGLPRSGIIVASLEWQTLETGEETPTPLIGLQDGSGTLVAFGTPPFGLTYYRLRETRLDVPLAGPSLSATDQSAPLVAASLVTHNAGASLAQSIGKFLDVAATIRFVRGVASVAPLAGDVAREAALDRAADVPGHGSQTVDVDVGALVAIGRLRAGLVARNVWEPAFDTDAPGVSISLDRQVRAGVAWYGSSLSTVVACDVDLTRTSSAAKPRRHVAIGGEHWWAGRRFGARAGLRLNTIDEAHPAGSAGASVGLTSSVFLDAQLTHGGSSADRSWGVGVRFAY
jgi:F plasmid transfer operon, TraF, protein